MGNILCKNRTNRSGNSTSNGTPNAKNPVDRVIGECMQICPNGIRKKKHFWEKQVFETAPPQEAPMQEQPKSEHKNGWQNANLSVPDHPIAPPRKKRTLQRNIDPSNKNSFEEIHLNQEIPEKYNERSVDPPEITTHITTNATTTITTVTTGTNTSNNDKNNIPQKVTRTVSKVGNKKSDKFFGESLSDLSTDYENNATLDSTQSLSKHIEIKSHLDNNNKDSKKINSDNNKNKDNKINNDEKNIIAKKNVEIIENDPNAIEVVRESVVDLVDDIEEELNRKIIKERGNLMFAMEKHISKEKSTSEDVIDERFKGQKPCTEDIIVPVRKVVKRHICDDDDKIREIVSGQNYSHHHHTQSKHEKLSSHHHTDNTNNLDPNAPKKPQRDFAKYRKSLNGDDFDTNQIIEAIKVNDNNDSNDKEKKENSTQTQTTGKLAIQEKAHHAKKEAENINKNVKSLINQTKNTNVEQNHHNSNENDVLLISPVVEMKNFINNIEKLQNELHQNTGGDNKSNEIENTAKNLVNNIIDSAQNCINSANLHSELNQEKSTIKSNNDKNIIENINEVKMNDLKKDTNTIDLTSIKNFSNKDKKIKTELNATPEIKKESDSIIKTTQKNSDDYLQQVITAPISKLSDKTTAALKEAQALKDELNSSLLNQTVQIKNEIQIETKPNSNINKSEIHTDTTTTTTTIDNNNDSNNKRLILKKEKSVEDCIDCMKNDAVNVINEVVQYAEKVCNDPKIFAENYNSNQKIPNENEKYLIRKPSIILFEENGTANFIEELKKDASQTINDVYEYAKKTVNENVNLKNENENIITESIVESNNDKPAECNTKINLISTIEVVEQNTKNLRPNRISEITPPTQIQQKIYRRSNSTQSVTNSFEKMEASSNQDILNEIFAAVHIDHEKSKSANNILENEQNNNNHGLPPRPKRNSEINKPAMVNSEKILRRCLSTQSYLTPNLIEKIALQANILSMPDPEDLGTNDGSSLVSPICRLESKRSIINSQTSLNNEKLFDNDLKTKTTIVSSPPPLVPKKPSTKDENQKNIDLMKKHNMKKNYHSPLSSPPREPKIISPITTRSSPLTTRSPSPARPSRIPELPKSKLTKRLSRSLSKQSNPNLTDIKKSQEFSDTLKKFLNEKDLKPQEILDLIEFEFGDCMFSEIVPDDDKKIIMELKKSVKMEQQIKLSPPLNKSIQKSPPLKSEYREILVRQNSQSSDSSSSKKSPDRLKSSRIPVLKNNINNNKTLSELNNYSDFRRHSIDDLDSWFNPHHPRKRDSSLQYDYNFDENLMNSSLTEKNIAIKQFLDKSPKTKSAIDLSKPSISFSLIPEGSLNQLNLSQENENSEHSALLKYLDNKN